MHANPDNMKKISILISGLLVAALAGWFLYNKYRVIIPPVDISRSEIGWSGNSLSGGHMGKISLKKAELQFQDGQLKGGSFEADMNSITITDNTDPEENKSLLEHFANEDFFETKRFPTASFRIMEVKPKGNQLYQVSGIMKIKDKEQTLNFDAKVEPAGEKGQRTTATVAVDRTLFGIEYAAKGKPGSEKDWFIFNEFMLSINIVSGN